MQSREAIVFVDIKGIKSYLKSWEKVKTTYSTKY